MIRGGEPRVIVPRKDEEATANQDLLVWMNYHGQMQQQAVALRIAAKQQQMYDNNRISGATLLSNVN